MKKIVQLVFAILIVQSVGVIGSFATVSSIPTWYAELAKPSFSPPNWVFGPVWLILYTLIGISWFLVWQASNQSIRTDGTEQAPKEKKFVLGVFFVHLGLNALWSLIFFGLKNPFLALLEILFLLATLFLVLLLFWRISRVAVYLLIPYLLWISFAVVLNFAIWQLNP